MGLLEEKLKGLLGYIEANTPRATRPVAKPSQVIDQGLFGGRIGQVPQRAQEMYQGLLNAPAELAALGGQEMNQSVRKELTQPRQANPQKWMDAGMELAGMAPVGGLVAHTVYHGSPHKFDKFDMSKIGTGEGAQAYGHGLYFAESPAVAREYQRQLTPGSGGTPKDIAARWLNDFGGNADAAMSALRTRMSQLTDQADIDQMRSAYGELFNPESLTGALYKVDIPDEAIPRMLDWDKPLREQAGIHEQLRPVVERVYGAGSADYILGRSSATAKTVLDDARRVLGDSGMAESAMKQAGIPGIRYLDGSSRNAGQGTSNFVLFDDQLPRILEVNGQPTGLLSYADEAAQKGGGLLGKVDNAEMNSDAIQKAYLDAISQDPHAVYGVRVIPNGYEVKEGDLLEHSKVWVDGEMTDEVLPGVSTIGIEKGDVAKALERLQKAGYSGKQIAIVKGDSGGYGEDAYERLIKNPEVVRAFLKGNK